MNSITGDLNLISSFLARRDVASLSMRDLGDSVDVVALIGSSLLGPLHIGAEALSHGVVKQLLVVGGVGHSTQDLRDVVSSHPVYKDVPTESRAEADIMRDILVWHLGVEPERIVVENCSTNCGANATESKRILDGLNLRPRRLVIVQDPTMQLRTHASFEKAWGEADPIELISFAPFVPFVQEVLGGFAVVGDAKGVWSFERFVSLVLGEVVRLKDDENGYGPRGKNFIGHVDVPPDVLHSYTNVSDHFSHRATAYT